MKKVLFAVPLAALALAIVTAGAAAQPGSSREHLFVGFGKAPGAAERAVVAKHGGTVRFSFPEVNALAIDLASTKVGDLARESGVRYIEQDPERNALALDPLQKNQLVPAHDNGLWGLVATQAVDAHSLGFTGAGVKACVADTGIDANHIDIAANYKGGYDAIDLDGDPVVDNDPFEAHGTHVAGTVLGVNNGAGIFGVAYGAELYHARVLADPDHTGTASGSTSQVMDGVRHLAQDFGCKVINMSLGGGRRSGTEENLYKQLTANGTLIVAAAGNDAVGTLDFPGGYPVVVSVSAVDRDDHLASFSSFGKGLDFAAPGVDVLSSVPNTTGREAKVQTADGAVTTALSAEFAEPTSDRGVSGTLVDCATGETVCANAAGKVALIQRGNITFAAKVANAMAGGAVAAIIYNNVAGSINATLGTETAPDGSAWIPTVTVTDTEGAALKANNLGQSVTVFNIARDWGLNSGTSMATPHVSGVAALVFASHPGATPAQVEQIMKNTARDLGPAGYDTQFGFGMPRADLAAKATLP
ncbi:MAG TPA: S8 family serine peptidase [Gaiellaceae bacterium]|nr:S8 family serine peptidase [Gaiellaceae bacterium]